MAASASQLESEFFNDHVAQSGEFNPFAAAGWNTIARRFSDWLPFADPVELLDVGCGTGHSKQIYDRHLRSYTGIDLSSEAVRIASRNHPAAAWICGDACALPFVDGRFDVVAFSSVLHHIPDFERALVEAARVLRPGGWVFAFDPNVLHPAMALFRHPGSPLYNPTGVSPNERPLAPGILKRAFRNAGLHAIQQRAQSNIPYRSVALQGMNRLLRLYNALDWAWERSGAGRWFGTFILTSGRRASAAPDVVAKP
ncbi:MAG: class I SAM-dependent methyltransferase [Planctomycetaceae bacterium]